MENGACGMIDRERLRVAAAAYDIELDAARLEQLDTYADVLLDWNNRMNLTAITGPAEVEEKHFLDCLILAGRPELAGSLLDVGSGAGFPGLVVKLYRPKLAVTLMEPTGKRVRFLQAAAQTLGLGVEVVNARAEEAGRKAHRERYDVVAARAVAPMGMLAEYCLPLARPGGLFIAMKGGEEPPPDAAGLAKLGGTHRQTHCYTLPGGAGRSLVLVDKTAPTPASYPRNGGVITKRPLWQVG